MKKILDDSQKNILRNRVFISRTIHVFKLEDISKEWKISIPTLFRYDSDAYRRLSQQISRAQHIKYKQRDKTKCQICLEPLKGHARCKRCTRLLHDDMECIHVALINDSELE